MSRILFLGILAVSLLQVPVQAVEPFKVIDLWPGTPPGEKGGIGEEHDTTKAEDREVAGKRVVRLTDVSKPTLSIFRPAPEKNTGTGIVLAPGGAYRILAMDLEGEEVCQWLNSIGVTVGLLKYRVPKREGDERHQLPLQDAQRALRVFRHNAKAWGVEESHIGVMGFSAGGHLMANLSNNYGERAYMRVDQIDEVSCRPDFSILIYPAYLVPKDTNQLAPEMKVTEKTPPTFLTMALDDPLRPENVLLYAAALRKSKVPFEMHVYESGGHGFGLRPVKEYPATYWPEHLVYWLRGRELMGTKAGVEK